MGTEISHLCEGGFLCMETATRDVKLLVEAGGRATVRRVKLCAKHLTEMRQEALRLSAKDPTIVIRFDVVGLWVGVASAADQEREALATVHRILLEELAAAQRDLEPGSDGFAAAAARFSDVNTALTVIGDLRLRGWWPCG